MTQIIVLALLGAGCLYMLKVIVVDGIQFYLRSRRDQRDRRI